MQLSLARSGEPYRRARIATVSDHSMPAGAAFVTARLQGILVPPPGRPHTLVLELTGGARLQVGDAVSDLKPDPAIHRHVFAVAPSDHGIPFSLQYMPFNTPAFFRLLVWDRDQRTLSPMPRTWCYPTLAETTRSETPRTRMHWIALALLGLSLAAFRRATPPLERASAAATSPMPVLVAMASLLALYGGTALLRMRNGEPLQRGDARAFLEATRSLVEDGDLDLHGQAQLHLYEGSTPNAFLSESETVVALGKNGELYPKHPWLLPVLAAPFYRALGERGFIVLNLLALMLIAGAMYASARLAQASPRASALVTVLLGASPIFIAYAYSISIDLLGAALGVAGAVLAACQFPLLGGLLLGGSLLARVTHVWLVLAAVLVMARWRALFRLGLGLAIPIACLLVMNWRMFGDPLVMSYNRVLVLVQGERAIASHTGLFDRALIAGLLEQLIDWPRGLIYAAPLALLAWIGWPRLLCRRGALALAWCVAAAGLCITFAVYVYAADSPFGVRFLLPVVGLAAAPLASALGRLGGDSP
ncbi:MAG: hypothetical protein U1E76_05185 [Planctomycetota bacterium]